MGQPADKIEGELLPEAELNPLLNPLLAAQMGRWAEVYFTNPPEKRAQAVSDLVRELRSETPAQSSSMQPTSMQATSMQPMVEKEPTILQTGEPKTLRDEPSERVSPPPMEASRRCKVCSAENPAQQKFCGMCGAPLQSSPHAAESNFSWSASAPEIAPALHEPEKDQRGKQNPEELEDQNEIPSSSERELPSVEDAAPYHAEPTLSFGGYASRGSRQSEWAMADADLPHFAVESESVPYRYRLYLGIAVALVLGGLLYMAWRGKSNVSGDASESVPARVIPPAPARATPANPPESVPERSVIPTEKATDAGARRTPQPPASTSSAPAATAQKNPGARPDEAASASDAASKERTPSPRIVSVAANSSAASSESSGAEELATAEKYLNGSYPGGARDNREAAQWLWKAVGKGNLTATMVLSDLYLRGDGIPKSCDQARLLLNVAARKGKASAGERIRNLQAFGCP